MASEAPAGRDLMVSEIVPDQVLPKVLKTFDMVAIYVYILFFINAAAIVSLGGWPTMPLWILGVVVFLIPAGMAVAELGNLWPAEGGIYIWASKTMSPTVAFFAGYLSWVPILLVGATHPAIELAFLQLAFSFTPSLTLNIILQLCLLWIPIGLALMKLRAGTRLANAIFGFYMVLVAAVLVGGIVVAVKNGGPVTPFHLSDLKHSLNFGLYGSFFGLILLNYLGVEAPFNMGAEVVSARRSIVKMVAIGSTVIFFAYVLSALGILLSTPLKDIDPLTGTIKVFAPLHIPGLVPIGAAAVVVTMLIADMTYQSTYSRLIFVSGLERHLPRVFTHLNPRTRNPVTALLVSGALISIIIVIVYSQQSLTNGFLILEGALVVLWLSAGYFFLIPVLIARHRFRDRYAEPFWRIPGGMAGAWFVVLVGTIGTTIGIYYTMIIPFSSSISKSSWITNVLLVSGLVVLLGVVVFFTGRRAAMKLNDDERLAHLAVLDRPFTQEGPE